MRTREVDSKDGNCMSSSTGPNLALEDEDGFLDGVLTRDPDVEDQVAESRVIPVLVCFLDVDVVVSVCG